MFADDALQSVANILVKRIKDDAAKNQIYRIEDAVSAMWIWKDYGESGELAQYLEEGFAAEPREAVAFLRSFVGTGWGLETGLPVRGEFMRNAYDTVAAIVSPFAVMEHVQKIYGDDIGTGDYYQAPSVDADLAVVRQFAHIHRQVVQQAQAGPGNSESSAAGAAGDSE